VGGALRRGEGAQARLGLSKKLEDRESLEIESVRARLELGSSSKRAELEPNIKLASLNEPSSNSSLKFVNIFSSRLLGALICASFYSI
jgi:hypothetical protein